MNRAIWLYEYYRKVLLMLTLLIAVSAVVKAEGPATIRPIEDFLERQGKFCLDENFSGQYVNEIVDRNFVGNCPSGQPPLLFVPPIGNFIGTNDPDKERSASIDYAGLANHWSGGAFNTSFSGIVTERPLADGRAKVQVLISTNNALTWVVDGFDFNGPLLLGNRAPEALGGAGAALGSSHIQAKFINTAPGASLPDLIQLFFFPEEGQELLFFGFRNQAAGPLQTLFGVPEGMPGLTTGVQTFLNGNPQCGLVSPSAVADCFPAEKIELHVIG